MAADTEAAGGAAQAHTPVPLQRPHVAGSVLDHAPGAPVPGWSHRSWSARDDAGLQSCDAVHFPGRRLFFH